MRRICLIFSLLAFTACAEQEAGKNTVAVEFRRSTDALPANFTDTTRHQEQDLLAAAGLALKAGASLATPEAERCWRVEEARPMLRDACALLWAGGGGPSPQLEQALASAATPLSALGAVMRRSPLRGFYSERMKRALGQLSGWPAWVKARALIAWLCEDPMVSREWVARFLADLPVADGGMLDTASPLELAFHLAPGAWQTRLAEFCDSAAIGISRQRCWRVIGALARPDLDPGIKQELAAFLPVPSDSDWKFFSATFPEQARRISRIFPKLEAP